MMSVLSRLLGRRQGDAGAEVDVYDKSGSAVSDGRRPVTVGDLTPEALQILKDVKDGQERANAKERAWRERMKQQELRGEQEDTNNSKYLSDPEIFREATLDDYNEWLLAWIKQGGKIANYYNYPYPVGDALVVTNPAAEIELMGMYGASSRNFIIPKEYSFKLYAHNFSLGHCAVYGWENGVAVTRKDYHVDVYSDTVDKQILAVANNIFGPYRNAVEE